MLRQYFIITLHAILTLAAYTAWSWLDYRIVIVLAVLHFIILEILQGCPLSHMQFSGDKEQRFYEWWLAKLGVTMSSRCREKMRVFMRYGLPVLIIILAVMLQVVLKIRVWITL